MIDDASAYNLCDFIFYFDYPKLKKEGKTELLLDHLLLVERMIRANMEQFKVIIRIVNPDPSWYKSPKEISLKFAERMAKSIELKSKTF